MIFAANLSMMFCEYDFLQRFAAARASGFSAVEFLFPYDYPPERVREEMEKHQLALALFNSPAGDWPGGERGLATMPGRQDDFRRSLEQALAYARVLSPRNVHIMAGMKPESCPDEQVEELFISNLAYAAQLFQEQDCGLLIEPINHYSMPGYFLNSVDHAMRILQRLRQQGIEKVKLQFDIFHCQRENGDVSNRLRACFEETRHYQLAGVPDRHEPDQSELHYPTILALIKELGYDGYLGCEYQPQGQTEAGLGWRRSFGADLVTSSAS